MNNLANDEGTIIHPIILFDGVCNLCNAFIDIVIRRDTKGIFRYASLQSEIGRQKTTYCQNNITGTDSVVLDEGGNCYIKSDAVLRIMRRLNFPWPLMYILIIFPKSWRNSVYDYVARNRYRWFGKRNTCRLPTSEERTRFLD